MYMTEPPFTVPVQLLTEGAQVARLVRADAGLLHGDGLPTQRGAADRGLLPGGQHGAQYQVRPGHAQWHRGLVANRRRLQQVAPQ